MVKSINKTVHDNEKKLEMSTETILKHHYMHSNELCGDFEYDGAFVKTYQSINLMLVFI